MYATKPKETGNGRDTGRDTGAKNRKDQTMKKAYRSSSGFFRRIRIWVRVGLALVLGSIAIVTFGVGANQWVYAFQFREAYAIVMDAPV
ncbi:MAG: hypothetical protein AAB737_02065, partial [Patescibacteria group bacterium]